MANNCYYDLIATGSRESCERLIRIMRYEDPVFYLYRVFSVESDGINDEGSYCWVRISGDVAWGSGSWYDNNRMEIGDKGRLYTDLRFLSEHLKLNIEWTGEECGNAFAEHYAVVDGERVIEEVVDLTEPWFEAGTGLAEILEKAEKTMRDLGYYSDGTILGFLDKIREEYREGNEMTLRLGGFEYDFYPIRISEGHVHDWPIYAPEIMG